MRGTSAEGEELTCDVCGSSAQVARVFRARDYEYGVPGEWAFARCAGCEFYFQTPRPSPEAVLSFYPSSYSAYGPGSILGWMFRAVYALDARRVARLIGASGRILDVGCGDGSGLLAMRRRGMWEVSGVEVNEEAVGKARSMGLRVHAGELATCDLPHGSFDLIRMGHVIEHVLNPVKTLKRAYELLRPGGILFGETPNTSCLDFRLLDKYWGALHVPRHITLFNVSNLQQALTRVGFRRIEISSRLRTVGWSAGIQNVLADRVGVRVPPGGRVKWYPLLIAMCLPLTMLQCLFSRPATIAFVARKPADSREASI